MNPIVKQKWVAALRSGNYTQSTKRLHNDGGWCCLGVLCDIAEKSLVVPSPIYRDECGEYQYGLNEESAYLPDEVKEWARLSDRDPRIGEKCLSVLNDDGSSFEEIANLIEAQL